MLSGFHNISADTTASTYDSDYAFFFLFYFFSFISFLYFLVSLKRCCNHAHLFLKISSYLDCMPQRSLFCCLFLFLFCFLLLINFLFHYVFYGGTEIKDTDTDSDTEVKVSTKYINTFLQNLLLNQFEN